MGEKLPSPCLDVCKYKRKGACIACAMSKSEKSSFKKLDSNKKRRRFIAELLVKQDEMGGFGHWPPAYRRKCRKKGVACPIDALQEQDS